MDWNTLVFEVENSKFEEGSLVLTVSSSVRRKLRDEFKNKFPLLHYFAFGVGETYQLRITTAPYHVALSDLNKKTLDWFEKNVRLVPLEENLSQGFAKFCKIDMWRNLFLEALIMCGGEAEFYKRHWDIKHRIQEDITKNPNIERWKDEIVSPRVLTYTPHPVLGQTKKPSYRFSRVNNSIYHHENDKRYFISIDLKQANFQMLKQHGLVTHSTWEEYLQTFTDIPWFWRLKKWRMVVLSEHKDINPKKQQVLWENCTIDILETLIKSGFFREEQFAVFNSDEILFHSDQDAETKAMELEQFIKEHLKEYSDFVKVDCFQLRMLSEDKPYYARVCKDGKFTFKCVDYKELKAAYELYLTIE